MRSSLTFGFLMILGAAATGKAAPSKTSVSVKISLAGGRPVVSRVFLNGQGPFRFLLDTGAQTNQIDAAIARKLAVAPSFRVNLATATGSTQVGGARLAEVVLGNARATDQEFLFTTLDGVHALSGDIQGVLGQEFLSRFDYLLDLQAKTLDFEATPPQGDRIPTEEIDGRPAFVTSAGRLVLDSGSDTLVLFHARPDGAGSGAMRTASNFVAVQTGSSIHVGIGSRDYKPAQSAIVPQPEAAEDGLLPMSVFKAVYVSNSGGYAIVDPVSR